MHALNSPLQDTQYGRGFSEKRRGEVVANANRWQDWAVQPLPSRKCHPGRLEHRCIALHLLLLIYCSSTNDPQTAACQDRILHRSLSSSQPVTARRQVRQMLITQTHSAARCEFPPLLHLFIYFLSLLHLFYTSYFLLTLGLITYSQCHPAHHSSRSSSWPTSACEYYPPASD